MDDIAIVGMSVRLPGAESLSEYWRLISEGRKEAVRHSRAEMLSRGAASHLVDDPHWVNASVPLADAEKFDAKFFGYAAREAETMDPQHRIFLECAYSAFEDALIDPYRSTKEIGVYAGTTMNTYVPYNLMANGEVYHVIGDLQTMIGNDKDYLATRVSYKLNLTGPSMAIQTACSSSLVAVHVAVRALLDDECEIALAGGSSLRMPHGAGYMANPGGTSSPDGHCRTFDKDAKGSIPGSGAGAVVLKRLQDAVRDGDRIWAVIAGSGLSNDGASKASFSAPSVSGQARAAAKALQRAGVDGASISYVEAHGTGTLLGDPIEVAALTRAYARQNADGVCWLGSVKPNIGHLDAGAGIAGLIKTALVVHKKTIPTVANFREASPHLNLQGSGFDVPLEQKDMSDEKLFFAAVNSLGMGGTNAHVVLRNHQGQIDNDPESPDAPDGEVSLLLSAKSEKSLEAMSLDLAEWIGQNKQTPLTVLEQALMRRPQHGIRQVVHASNSSDAVRSLKRRTGRNIDVAKVPFSRDLVWLLPGQGSDVPGMLAVWYNQYPEVTSRVDRVLSLFDAEGIELRDYLISMDSVKSDNTSLRSQSAVFASQWAIGDALIGAGLVPTVMLGHSVGEWSAATLAGVLTLEDAVKCIVERGRAMDAAEEGAMLWVALGTASVQEFTNEAVSLAAVNSSQMVTLSGRPEDIARTATVLVQRGIAHGHLDVERAFHSPLIDAAADRVRDLMSGMRLNAPAIPFISSLTGLIVESAQASDPDYWRDQTLSTVQFGNGAELAFSRENTGYLELAAKPVLSSLVDIIQTRPKDLNEAPLLTSAPESSLREFSAGLWLQGAPLAADPAVFLGNRPELPPYRFDRVRLWLEPRSPMENAAAEHSRETSIEAPRAEVEKATSPSRSSQQNAGASSVVGADRLSAEQSEAQSSADQPQTFVNVRQELSSAWRDLLGADQIDDEANFFDLGGHSLLATQLVMRLRSSLGVEIPMITLFEAPTFGDFATRVEAIPGSANHGSASDTYNQHHREETVGISHDDRSSTSFGRLPGETDEQFEARLREKVDVMTMDEAQALLDELEREGLD